MNKFFKYILSAAVVLMTTGCLTSCVKDLDVEPIDPSLQSDVTPEQLFNKCYSVFATSGNNGGDDNVDVDGLDGGFQHKYRQMWNSNELTTDEAICGWGDEGIPSYCHNTYDASHPMLRGLYYGLCIGITFCNQYLEEFPDYDGTMTAEVRFLRAMQFYLLTDAFGNIPFATSISGENPEQYTRPQVCEFIESELKDIIGEGESNAYTLNDPKPKKYGEPGYGRIDKAAAWMLLARLYLNSEVYTGTARWQDAANYAQKVMNSGYKLHTEGYNAPGTDGVYREFTAYQMLFMGDNAKSDAAYEAVFPVIQDGLRTTSWGGTNFLMCSTVDADVHPNPYDESEVNGLYNNNTWGGNRARPELIRLFFPNDDAPEGHAYAVAYAAGDDRALFETEGRFLNVEDESNFKYGYAIAKFNNFKCDGSKGSDNTFADSHLFYMRVAEAYLTYAEALTRLNGGTAPAEAVAAINAIRGRAHATQRSSYTLNQILDEWGREFYFEGRRRVDLIRFGKFGGTTDYKWQWKGGAYAGRDFEAFRNVFAIPTDDLIANSNLTQNPGY